MILTVNNDEEEASAWRALATIRSLLERDDAQPLRPNTQDSYWCHTRWANERYL